MRTLTTTRLRTLDISAASGLARLGDRFYVVADDELGLYSFPALGDGPMRGQALFPGALPDEPAARKAVKPDLEALATLSLAGGAQALLALPSGSTLGRSRGSLIQDGRARSIDFAPFYASLRAEIPELNLEGAVVAGRYLVLLQRGNGRTATNALILLSLAEAAMALTATGMLPAALSRTIIRVALGDLAGTPLGFTDAAAVSEDRFAFVAAAEATDDPYLDGACAGSVVGLCGLDGRVDEVFALTPILKFEGLHAEAGDGGLDFFLVTDADDRARPAELRQARIEAIPTHRQGQLSAVAAPVHPRGARVKREP